MTGEGRCGNEGRGKRGGGEESKVLRGQVAWVVGALLRSWYVGMVPPQQKKMEDADEGQWCCRRAGQETQQSTTK